MSSMQYIEALKFLVNSIGKKYTFCTETCKAEEAPPCPPQDNLFLPVQSEPSSPIIPDNNIKKEIAMEMQGEREEVEEACRYKGLQGGEVCPQTRGEEEALEEVQDEFYLSDLKNLNPELKEKYYDYLYHYHSYKNGIEKHLIHLPPVKEIREKYFDLYKKIIIRRDRITVFLNDLLSENITVEEFTVNDLKKLLQDLFKHYCSVNNKEYLENYKAPEQTEFF